MATAPREAMAVEAAADLAAQLAALQQQVQSIAWQQLLARAVRELKVACAAASVDTPARRDAELAVARVEAAMLQAAGDPLTLFQVYVVHHKSLELHQTNLHNRVVQPVPQTDQKLPESELGAEESSEVSPPTSSAIAPPVAPIVKQPVMKRGVLPDSEIPPDIRATCRVYEDSLGSWHALLMQSNLGGTNTKFYIVQLLACDSTGRYGTWNRWGRAGMVGQSALYWHQSLSAAKAEFVKKFKQKTSNDWGSATFVVRNPSYTLVSEDVAEDHKPDNIVAVPAPALAVVSSAPAPAPTTDPTNQALASLVGDLRERDLTGAATAIGFDVRRCPLSKLSRSQCLHAYEILKQLEDAIVFDTTTNTEALSAQFYNVIPHQAGCNSCIRDVETLVFKLRMLEQLDALAFAAQCVSDAAAFNCSVSELDQTSEQLRLLHRYLQNTNVTPPSSHVLEIEQAFVVDRHIEATVFCGNSIDNHTLLWYGCPADSVASILSQGLQLPPQEAPVTLFPFGKGVYFADMCCKYNNSGVLLLCEVALGTPRPLLSADHTADDLPAGTHSTWAQGRMEPDAKEDYDIILDGMHVRVPAGHAVDAGRPGASLMHNEFIVYNTDQIRIRYLLRVRLRDT